MENYVKEMLLNFFFECFNKMNYEKVSLEEIMVIMKECFDEFWKDRMLKGKSKLEYVLLLYSYLLNGGEYYVYGYRKWCGVGGNY